MSSAVTSRINAPAVCDYPHPPPVFRAPERADWPVSILGVPFDNVSSTHALARIADMVESRRPHYVVTANVDFLVQAHRDVELRRILVEADLVLCDGTPLVWASRWLGNPLPERVAGSDIAPGLIALAAARGYRLFFLGAAPGVAAEAAARLRREYPTLQIVGHYSPPFADLLAMDHAAIVDRIRAAQPDVLLVSFGCPKQEKWIAMHHRALNVPVCIGVGATLDFLAGRVRRAPQWMRRTGCEWLFRLGLEPRRLYRRYASDLRTFVPALLTQWWRMSRARPGRISPPTLVRRAPDWRQIDVGPELTQPALERHRDAWREIADAPAHCVLDVSHVERIDATGVAFLARCRKAYRQHDRQFVLVAPSRAVRAALDALRLSDFFAIAPTADDARQVVTTSTPAIPVLHDGTLRSLAWCGEILAANVEDVWEATTGYLRTFIASGATLVIVDLSRLRFTDSAGAGLMLRLKRWARDFSAEILFTHPQPNVRNVLRLTRLEQLLLEGAQ